MPVWLIICLIFFCIGVSITNIRIPIRVSVDEHIEMIRDCSLRNNKVSYGMITYCTLYLFYLIQTMTNIKVGY